MGRSLATILAAMCLTSAQALAEPETYELDGAHTHIVWEVDRFGFTRTMGSFTDIAGVLTLDEDAPANSTVTAEITLAGLRSDLRQREDIVRGKFWLKAEAFPIITYRSTKVRLLEPDGDHRRAEVTGLMTLAGVEAPMTMIVRLNKLGHDPVTKRKAAGFSAHGAFKRSDFGVRTALGPVGDEVSFRIEALAIAADGAEGP